MVKLKWRRPPKEHKARLQALREVRQLILDEIGAQGSGSELLFAHDIGLGRAATLVGNLIETMGGARMDQAQGEM